ncbi:hypothetical protein BFR57_00760 [Idiomarina sp. MD25a]|uniref:sensor domain-containing phosphodiesterase n=1 Tax=Idiomarina sp. MD25a TaxID=1889913 RepID=UPI0008F84E1C|nr:diguanylate cyclase [Idiomarina sp. MD25a]OIM99143.1 hypothetical protein BFR57_00760 [Idiomarina sp. MD25a]
MAASSGPNNNQTELARENQKLTKVIERLKRLTYSYRSAEVVQKALFRISELAASARSMDNFYQSVHAIIGELMYARNFYVCFYEPEKKVVSFAYFVDEFDEKQAIEQMPMESLARGLTGYVMRTGQSLLCPPDVFQQLIQQGEVEEMGSAPVDWLGVPLISGSNVIGAMVVQSYHDNHRYDENDKDLLTFVSQHVVNALERLKQKEILQNEIAHQTAELRHANESLMKEITVREKVEQQTSVLFAISELTNTSEDMVTFYEALHSQIATLIHADNFYVALVSSDNKYIRFPYHKDERDNKAERRRIGKGLTEYVMRKAEPAFIDAKERALLTENNEIKLTEDTGSVAKQWLGSPLVLDGKAFGVIAVQTYDDEFLYKHEDLELLNFVSQHVAVAIERRRANEEIQRVNQFLEKKVEERTEELVSEIERRKKIEARLFHDAHHDSLTGLPNRALFTESLQQALAHQRRHPEHFFAVLFLDLDRFKTINDTLGHSAGDEFLLDVSKRIQTCVRENDLVARLGGDEFVILLDTMSSVDDAREIAKRIISSLNEPFILNGHEHYSGASIGIAMCDDSQDSVERLLRDADAAMYEAKSQGRGRYVVFDNTMHRTLVESVKRERALRHARIDQDFFVEFETIADIEGRQQHASEAFLQWNIESNRVKTSDYLALAEKTGLIVKLDQYLLKRCCEHLLNSGQSEERIHLNLSVRHLLKSGYIRQLLNIVERYKVNPSQLVLEFSETALTQNDKRSVASLRRLSQAGFKLVIDHFGRGAGPLQFLYNYPFSKLKLDQDYVMRLESSSRARAMLRHVATLCEELEIELYAAGVKTESLANILSELGVEYGQGAYVTKCLKSLQPKSRTTVNGTLN